MFKETFKKYLKLKDNNHKESGIALLMVMSSITILTYLIVDFTFETHVNKLRVHNVTDQLQARLTAEAGLNLSLARIRLYQEARNIFEQNEALQGMIDLSVLEETVRSPDFMFPIPILDGQMNQNVQSSVSNFNDDSVIQGQLNVRIVPVSGFLNPNNLRVEQVSEEDEFDNLQPRERRRREQNQEEDTPAPHEVIENTLIDALRESMERKIEEDDLFDIRYGNLDPELLIKELKYFVNHPEDFQDSERAEIEALYRAEDITPKHAPLTSLDELYLLQGWPDAIVDLIKDRLTVHEVSVIQVNDLTENQLRVLFPHITDFQVEEFFLYRDGDPERNEPPRPFRSASEFKDLVVDRISIIDSQSFDDMMSAFEAAGLSIGIAGKLFRVTSQAFYNRATFTLEAYIDLPIKPQPPPPPEPENTGSSSDDRQRDEEGRPLDQEDDFEGSEGHRGQQREEEKIPVEYLAPRVVEIRRL